MKAAGILTCRGCGKDFCYRHVAEHRQELNKQMDEITTNHDLFQQTIVEQQTEPNSHPLLKQIDLWEENSIEKIHQTAKNAREELLKIIDKNRLKITDDLILLTQELSKARDDDDFVETNLKEWTGKLNQLKLDLGAAETIDFGSNDHESALIPKIFIRQISNDSFEKWFGDIEITDHGQLISHGPTNQIATVYSKEIFSTGQHTFRLKIENLYTTQYFVFGISVNDLNLLSSIHLPKCGRSLIQYGYYSEYNRFSLFSFINSNNIIQKNDILSFQIDCLYQRIRVINERTNYQQEFNSNQTKCKLPWRMVFGLFHSSDCVRLC